MSWSKSGNVMDEECRNSEKRLRGLCMAPYHIERGIFSANVKTNVFLFEIAQSLPTINDQFLPYFNQKSF